MKSKLLLMLFVCGSLLPLRAQLLPLAGDAFWRDSIPQEMRKSYIKYGERYLGKPWKELPLDVFAEFRKTGNRSNFENISFEKRRQLAAIVMAEIIEGKGRFMGDILKGMDSFIAETWWGIPAHYPESAPKAELQEVDLFNAETASLIAWTRYMLQKQFDTVSPGLCQRIDREIERRILIPAVEKEVPSEDEKGKTLTIPSLNGTWFTSKMHINHLNNAIQEMTQRDYGVAFMTGTKESSKKTVKELKSENEILQKLDKKVNELEGDMFSADFLDYLSEKKLKSGRSRAEQLQGWQKEYAEYVKNKVADEVATEMAAEVEAEKEPVPVNKPRKMPKKAPKVREVPVDTPTQQKPEYESNFDRQMAFIQQSRASMDKRNEGSDGLG